MTRYSEMFVGIIDNLHRFKKLEKIPEKHKEALDKLIKDAEKLNDNLRGFRILDVLPYSREQKIT